jgi:hypothetical protein
LADLQYLFVALPHPRWESVQIMRVFAAVVELLVLAVTVNLDSLSSKLQK